MATGYWKQEVKLYFNVLVFIMAVREGRKLLPPIPVVQDSVPQTLDINVPKDKTPKLIQDLKRSTQEYALMAEFNLLSQQKLPGVYVVPSASNTFIWNGILFIRKGMYQGGIFRFLLKMPENYPSCDCPSVYFIPPIFHPVINPETGELDVKRAFPKWRKSVNHLWQILLYVRKIFYKIDTKSPWNHDAAVLYDQIEMYESKVAQSIQKCRESIYEIPDPNDLHAIRFTDWDPDVHEEIRNSILNKTFQDKPNLADNSSGLSWMNSENSQIFSKEDTTFS
ncbi:Hypothetical predicted protein [Octopus vulgaris]|uniref:UBC core domain-containing protein n=2 Tax=Octopus vulgaris TaxID=6645 RepID=A0AA36AQY7_OCTVU|nr:Hypothetical predicted protein [Octopus vulgaris]